MLYHIEDKAASCKLQTPSNGVGSWVSSDAYVLAQMYHLGCLKSNTALASPLSYRDIQTPFSEQSVPAMYLTNSVSLTLYKNHFIEEGSSWPGHLLDSTCTTVTRSLIHSFMLSFVCLSMQTCIQSVMRMHQTARKSVTTQTCSQAWVSDTYRNRDNASVVGLSVRQQGWSDFAVDAISYH